MKDTPILIALIVICFYFGTMITFSPAPLWLKIPVDIILALIALGCLDAILAIRYHDRKGSRP